jgi:hypothetical protein
MPHRDGNSSAERRCIDAASRGDLHGGRGRRQCNLADNFSVARHMAIEASRREAARVTWRSDNAVLLP